VTARTRAARSVAAGLRLWAAGHGPHVQAAVELLISHEVWLRRVEFQAVCLHRDSDGAYWIDWTAARAGFDGGMFARASTSERAVLDLAIALGQDRFRLGVMSTGKARLIAAAVAAAAGIPTPRRTSHPNSHSCDDCLAAAGGSEMTS
jgi:hypothetical protein